MRVFYLLALLPLIGCSAGKQTVSPPRADGGDARLAFKDGGGDGGRPDGVVAADARRDVLSPDTLSPDTLSPDTLSPDTLSPDTLSPDTLSPDLFVPPNPLCGTAKVRLVEIAIGTPDYVGIKNYGSTSVSIGGFELEMTGTSVASPTRYTLPTRTLAPGATVYYMESSTASLPNDVNTGVNIPFFNGPPATTLPNATALRDTAGKLLDYWAVGATAENKPSGVTFTPQTWPTGFDSATYSLQRQSNSAVCPVFKSSDWGMAALSH